MRIRSYFIFIRLCLIGIKVFLLPITGKAIETMSGKAIGKGKGGRGDKKNASK